MISGLDEINTSLYKGNTIVGANSVLFRKYIYEQVGGADGSLKLLGDWLQWMRMLTVSDYYYLAQNLASSRVHHITQRQSQANNGTLQLEALLVLKEINKLINVHPSLMSECAEKYSISWLQTVRSGRYNGSIFNHIVFFTRLFRFEKTVSMKFALLFPYHMLIWMAKRTLFRHRCEGI